MELAEATRDLGGTLMVLGSPKQRDLLPGVSYDQAFEFALDVLGRAMPKIGEFGVDLCIEPLAPSETDFLNTCDQANVMIERVGHPNFKLHMDVKAQSGETNTTCPRTADPTRRQGRPLHTQDVNLRGPGMETLTSARS